MTPYPIIQQEGLHHVIFCNKILDHPILLKGHIHFTKGVVLSDSILSFFYDFYIIKTYLIQRGLILTKVPLRFIFHYLLILL